VRVLSSRPSTEQTTSDICNALIALPSFYPRFLPLSLSFSIAHVLVFLSDTFPRYLFVLSFVPYRHRDPVTSVFYHTIRPHVYSLSSLPERTEYSKTIVREFLVTDCSLMKILLDQWLTNTYVSEALNFPEDRQLIWRINLFQFDCARSKVIDAYVIYLR